jgi:hypothetical protein
VLDAQTEQFKVCPSLAEPDFFLKVFVNECEGKLTVGNIFPIMKRWDSSRFFGEMFLLLSLICNLNLTVNSRRRLE